MALNALAEAYLELGQPNEALGCIAATLPLCQDRPYYLAQATLGLIRSDLISGSSQGVVAQARQVEEWSTRYSHFDHLASLALLQGHIVWDRGLAPPEWGSGSRAAFSHYQNACRFALRYNRYLLDEILQDSLSKTLPAIIPHCLARKRDGRKMLEKLRDWWENDDTLVLDERAARDREPGEGQRSFVARITEALDRAVDELRERLGDDVYSTAGETIEEVVGRQLLARGWRVALAESCTAGAVTARLVNVPGSSAYVDCAAVTYSNRAKSDMLGVPPETIAAHGAVSEPVAAAMAVGIRDRAGVDVGVAITGIAGPGGGTPEKPVGTVVVAIAAPGADTLVKTLTLPGGRAQVRHVTTQSTLDLLRRVLGSAGSR